MKCTAPNNHNFYEESPLPEKDLKSAVGGSRTLRSKENFLHSVFELTTKSGSLEQMELFRFKTVGNKLEDDEQLILKLFAKEDRDSSKKYIVQTGLFVGVVYHNNCQV